MAVMRFCNVTPILTEFVPGEGWRIIVGVALADTGFSNMERERTRQRGASDLKKFMSLTRFVHEPVRPQNAFAMN